MKNIAIREQMTKLEDLTLEQLLDKLVHYGKPRVSYLGDGWHSNLEMYVNSEGTEFKIKSDFNHKTALDATKVVVARMNVALEKLK